MSPTFQWLPEIVQVPPSMLVQVGSYASLAYTACEWLSGLPFEVTNIWKQSGVPRHLRFIYVLSRYTSIVGQGLHLVAFNYLLGAPKASPTMCNIFWFYLQHYTGAFVFLQLQIVLSKRVLVLWRNDRRIAAFLIFLFALDLGAGIIFIQLATAEIRYVDMNCFIAEFFPRTITYLCAIELFVQVCLGTLAFVRYQSFGRELSQRNAIQLVSRESLLVVFLASVILGTVVANGLWRKLTVQVASGISPAYPIFMSIITSVTCWTIKAMHAEKMKLLGTASNEEEGLSLISIDAVEQ